jgi:hypothetical protein
MEWLRGEAGGGVILRQAFNDTFVHWMGFAWSDSGASGNGSEGEAGGRVILRQAQDDTKGRAHDHRGVVKVSTGHRADAG